MIRAAGRQCPLKELAKGCCQLIRAAGGLGAATDADELIPHFGSLLALHECTDTLQVAVAATHELDILDDALVADDDVDETAASALRLILQVSAHYSGFMLV